MRIFGALLIAVMTVSSFSGCKKKPAKKAEESASPAAMAGMDMAGDAMKPAAMARTMTPPPRPKTPFEKAVEDLASTDAKKREAAVSALGKIKDKKVVPYLVKALGDSAMPVRYGATYSLIGHRDPEIAPALIKFCESGLVTGLKNESMRWNFQLNCMKNFRIIHSPETIKALERWSKSRQKDVAKYAKGELKTAKVLAKKDKEK